MKDKILKLKKEKNAIILAHYYVCKEVQDIADYVGDSFYLAKVAKETTAKQIIFAGVEFMGESAKILNPEKRVFMPDATADCPMAHMVTEEEIAQKRAEYDDLAVVCYINSTAEIKTLSDVCVTSANAVTIVKKLPQKNIFFIPDQNLGDYVRRQVPEKNVMTNDGFCPRHHMISKEDILRVKAQHPNAKIAVHPECRHEVLEEADYIGSTSGIIDYVVGCDAHEFIIGTVDGVFPCIEEKAPGKKLYRVVDSQVCVNMLKVTMEKVLDVLEHETNEVFLHEEFMEKAKKPLDEMLRLAK